MSAPNLHTHWASLFLDGLAASGVREVVIAPGSRSTPFALAAWREPRMNSRAVVDERSAAFFALGQAKVTGMPTLVICTSGTAGAHFLPAVVEAAESRTPLLLLTADRPPEAHRAGAHQTTDQTRLFGAHARCYVELGLPDEHPEALRALRRIAAQAVFDSRHPLPGPVHLNAWLRKPLEPQPGESAGDRALEAAIAALRGRPVPRAAPPAVTADRALLAEAAEALRRARRGLIVAGPAPIAARSAAPAVVRLALATRYPLLAEITSQLRTTPAATTPGAGHDVPRVEGFDLVLRSERFRAAHPPEILIQIGAPPTSEGWRRLVEQFPDCPRLVIARYGWNDPEGTASLHLIGETGETCAALADALTGKIPGEPGAWEEAFRGAARAVRAVIAREAAADGAAPLGMIPVIAAIRALLPPRSLLAVGNSLPIRDLELWAGEPATEVAIWSQYGVRGIDGLISGAAGAASVWDGPALLLLGDLSLVHDLGGLALLRAPRAHPLVMVVISNSGGRIFEDLPVARDPELASFVRERMILPHQLDFAHAAALFGCGFRRARTPRELTDALSAALGAPAATLVEAVISPESAARERERVRLAVEAELG